MSESEANRTRGRRILLVAYYYPPDAAVGAVRPGRLAAALREQGHEVHVIAAGPEDVVDEPSGVDRVRPLAHPREWLQRIRQTMRRGDERANTTFELHAAGGHAVPDHPRAWKRLLLSMMWTPDDRQGFIWPAVRRAMLLASRAPFDAIYTSAPPFSVHLAGLLLRRKLGVPWIAEFRDPWLDGGGKGAHVRSRVMDAVEVRMERACLETADEVVTVTQGAAHSIGAKRAAAHLPSPHVILSGIDIIHRPRASRPPGPTRVLYLGTLYHGRDPRPLFRALAELRTSGRLPPGAHQFQFVGDCRWFHDLSVSELALEAGIHDVISLQDPVCHDEAQALLPQADLLLLLAQRQPSQVPHKLYEYLGAARPILAFADEHGETTRMLRRVGGHHVVTESMDECAATETVAAALRDATGNWTADTMKLEDWTTRRQMTKAVRLIEALT